MGDRVNAFGIPNARNFGYQRLSEPAPEGLLVIHLDIDP